MNLNTDDMKLPGKLRIKAVAKPLEDTIPEKVEEPVTVIQTPEPIEVSQEPYSVVDTEKVSRQISYGDGYDGTVYEFSRKISYEEFVGFCKDQKLDLNKLDGYAWYEDHAAIIAGAIKNGARWNTFDEGKSGDAMFYWTYLWVRAYTD